ncbi:hypothetical protein [Sorangium sp. So ce693]|uniref:hypothetical protein n=1 Tax=Sorangium sp. So ce693 TaxID=3133318 RepID=UPI003F61677F
MHLRSSGWIFVLGFLAPACTGQLGDPSSGPAGGETGGKNLGVNVGQYINNTTAQSSNKLLTSVMNALGYAATGIGIEPSCGPLPGFLA